MRITSQVKTIRRLYAIGLTGRGGEDLPPRLRRFATRFADVENGYTREEFDELVATVLLQAKAQAAGEPFSLALLFRLVTVPRPQRAELQERAIAERWSRNRLDAAIRATVGTRKNAGRRPRVPTSVEEILAHIEGQCEAWRRWSAEVQIRPGSKGTRKASKTVSLADLRGKRLQQVADNFVEATAAIERLQASVRQALRDRAKRDKVSGYLERPQRIEAESSKKD